MDVRISRRVIDRKESVHKNLNKYLIKDIAKIIFDYEYFVDPETIKILNAPYDENRNNKTDTYYEIE